MQPGLRTHSVADRGCEGALSAREKPGGLVYFTAPFLEPFHRVPQDFWRFTLDGASELLTAAGFKVVERRRIGNTALTTGLLLGFGVGDFTPEYLESWTNTCCRRSSPR